MKIKKRLLLFLSFIAATACSPNLTRFSTQTDVIEVDRDVKPDAEYQQIIAPYKSELDAEMNVVIGRAAKTLTKQKVESTLGNFVADLIQEKASEAWGKAVDMSAVTIGGLRVPINEGEITVGNVFELMPFENEIWILELDEKQSRQLFEYLAEVQNIAISNSVAVVEEDKLEKFYINGYAFDPKRTYTLAISDYLANGGDSMFFLKDAKRVAKLELKYRDAILDYIRELNMEGQPVDANIEGRVKLVEDND
jgi:2',3'-cyclic-nucleotide 2'-phosphodiesterase (5'-nucleotidase family)